MTWQPGTPAEAGFYWIEHLWQTRDGVPHTDVSLVEIRDYGSGLTVFYPGIETESSVDVGRCRHCRHEVRTVHYGRNLRSHYVAALPPVTPV